VGESTISLGLGLGGAKLATSSGRPVGGGFNNQFSASFDATDDHLFFGANATDKDITLGTTDFALSMWIYPVSDTQDFIFVDKTKADRTYLLGGELILKGYGTPATITISSAYTEDEWFHLVVTRTSGTEKVYINAVEKNSRSESGAFKISSFGYHSAGYYFQGKMDEISFHSAGLSASEVTAMYNSGSPIDISSGFNTSGWWRMGDDSSGTTINDQIGSENLTSSGANLSDSNVPS